MSTLWPRNKPLVQPPHFRTGQDAKPVPDPVIKAAVQALNRCRNERDAPKRVRGA